MIPPGYVLDTDVVSESTKPRPDVRVERWLAGLDEDRAFLSVATLAELRFGVERMPRGRRRERIAAWLERDLADRSAGRLLGVDPPVADAWGVVMARGRGAGVTVGVMDALLAATARAHGLTLATRNVRHFAALGVALLDPGDESGTG